MTAKLQDVAELAGVSPRTVSNVVNNAAAVAPTTRERVLRAVQELGYRPNLAARNLRRGRTGLIGLVIPELHSPYFAELAGVLVKAAEQRDWTVLIEQTAGRPDRERHLLEGADGHAVDGMIISPWSTDPAELVALAGDVPLVVLGERDPSGSCDHVAIDNVSAAREATAHLAGLGRRRIAAIGAQPHLHNGTAQLRLDGYRQALASAGLSPEGGREAPVASLHRPEGFRAMNELLDGSEPPDAVFCFSDELALGAMRAALVRGLRIPDDLAVVGFDDIEDGRFATPTLSTVAPDKQKIADSALQCLADRVYGRLKALPARQMTVGHSLVVRESSTRL